MGPDSALAILGATGYQGRRPMHAAFEQMLKGPEPILALAPMQDVTDLAFWRLAQAYGGADLYYTEYFRVYATSTPERHILRSILENPTRRPVIAQVIGNDVPALVRTARALEELPIVAVDLNLGCPAPVVYRKCAGGGLLRDLPQVDVILGALREAVRLRLTVKTRLGFDSPAGFDLLLALLAKHSVDLVTVHARTVHEGLREDAHYEYVTRAVSHLSCPVLANGNIHSAERALEVLRATGARGVMIGRGAVRNPWLFQQIRQRQRGEPMFVPTGREVSQYVHELYEAVGAPGLRERSQVERIKKHLNYLGAGIEPTGQFLHQVRRVTTRAELFRVCAQHLDHDRPMPLEPFPGL